jgi:hypothetical protein
MVTASRYPTLFESADGPAEGFRSAYVPLLLDKRGELQALRKAPGIAWDHMVPLIQLVPKPERAAGEARMTPADMIDAIAVAVKQHQFYLDPGGVSRRTKKSAVMSVTEVEAAFTQAGRRGLGFIPVVPLDRPDVGPLTAQVARANGAGMAARIRLRTAIYSGGRSLADGVASDLENLEISDLPTDLLLDLEYLAPEVDLDVVDLAQLIRSFASARSWRTITVAATTVPASYADMVDEGELRAINRREWGIYRGLTASGLTDVRFGDYGIQHCTPPDPMKVDKMVASIRMVIGESTWVARGHGALRPMTLAEKASQYQDLAARLVGVDGFMGRDCCPGDALLEDVALGRMQVRAPNRWREAGTLHSFCALTGDLAPFRQLLVARPRTGAHVATADTVHIAPG